jgi:FkbM family methyltransferase
MPDIPDLSAEQIAAALSIAGRSDELRAAVFEALRRAQAGANEPARFKNEVRWPIVSGLLSGAKDHAVRLANGLVFKVSADSRIERALLLSDDARPDHVWEPQTTKLLVALGRIVKHIVVGGAYIGDQALFIAKAIVDDGGDGLVHAFEPMSVPCEKLRRNIEANGLSNVIPHQLALWSSSRKRVRMDGPLALASSLLADDAAVDTIETTTIDDYAAQRRLPAVGLIMLDLEGGEEEALRGAARVLGGPQPPDVVFEIHRSFVDWSAGLPQTSIVRRFLDLGYEVFAIRDFHDNRSMAGQPIEIIPADSVYLEGPPHGFNVLATRRFAEIERKMDLRLVRHVSPKLLLERDPRLHHPLNSPGRDLEA